MPSLLNYAPHQLALAGAITFGLAKSRPDLLVLGSTAITFLAASAGTAVAAFLYLMVIYRNFIDPLRSVPGNKKLLNGIDILSTIISRPPKSFSKWKTKGDNLLYFPGIVTVDRLVLTGPKALADVLVNRCYDFEKPAQLRSILQKILGVGLVVAESDTHKTHRKKIMPAFSFQAIRNLYPMMMRKSFEMTDLILKSASSQLENSKEGAVVDISLWGNRATLDIIGVAGLGKDFSSMLDVDNELVTSYETLVDPSPDKLIYFFLQVLFPQWILNKLPLKHNKTLKDVTGILRRSTNELVEERIRAVKMDADSNFDVMSMMIKSGDFTNSQLIDHLLTFLAAGHETTAASLSWVCLLTAEHQDVQEKARKEVMKFKTEILEGSKDLGAILEKLPWLNSINQEAFRLFPTVPNTLRVAINDTVVAGQRVPKGTEIVIPPWTVNQDPTIWGPRAGEFSPERWIDFGKDPNGEDATPNLIGGAGSNYPFLTFLHGPRSCIGQGFAKAELRCLVAALLLKFRWRLDPNFKKPIFPAGTITIKPVSGLQLLLEPISD